MRMRRGVIDSDCDFTVIFRKYSLGCDRELTISRIHWESPSFRHGQLVVNTCLRSRIPLSLANITITWYSTVY
jgi:hypothetical protein